MSIRVRKFNPATIREGRILFLLGKRNTGKSVLLRDLLSHMPVPDYCIAMAPTEDSLAMFRRFLPECCIFDHFSQEKLERAVAVQRELVARGKKRTLLIILDDCMYNKSVLKSTAMRSIMFNGRHDHISLVCTAQYMMDIDVSIRTNIDYVFSLRENILTNRNRLWKFFFGQFSKYADFDVTFSACTQNHSCLVMDNTVATGECATDSVMWYRAAVEVPDFRLCRPVYWQLAEQCGRSRDEVRAAQARQFDIETATAEAMASKGGKAPAARITVVQTEDEHGQVVTSTA